MRLVKVKPVNNQINNLAIIDSTAYYRNKMLDDVGGVWYKSRNHYFNRKYRDTIPILYESPHYEIPFPLIARIKEPNRRQLRLFLKNYRWDKNAMELYKNAVETDAIISRIKAGDAPTVHTVLTQAGLDPNNFIRRNGDGKYAMKPHQLAALALYIKCKFSNNWGQMRTGKTPPTLIYMYWLLATNQIDLALCIVPNTIKRLWYDEIPKDMPKEMLHLTDIIEGTKAKKTALWHRRSLIKIVNYECVRADIDIVKEAFKDKRYIMVLDEAHNIKNPDAKQTQAVGDLEPDFLVALSGTPVANKPQDVFVPIHKTCPNLLGYSFNDFKYTFCRIGGYSGTDITGYQPGALEEINSRIGRISVRALRKDLKFGFGKQIQPAELVMSDNMRKIYKEVNTQFRIELLSSMGWTALRITSFLARLVRLQQFTAGYLPKIDATGNSDGDVIWVDDKDNTKMKFIDQFLIDYLDDLGKVVIFSRFIPVIKALAKRYSRYGVTYVCGEVKPDERVARVERFRRNPDCKILVVNIDIAAGMDMNPYHLPETADTQVAIFYERSWYYMPNEQAEDRITGMNQKAEATIIPLVCKDTIDEKLEYKVLPKKRRYAEIVLGDKREKLTEAELADGLKITQQDLFDLVGV